MMNLVDEASDSLSDLELTEARKKRFNVFGKVNASSESGELAAKHRGKK